MHLTTMYRSLVQRVDIQHFNVLANNWPPQYYAPHYYVTDLVQRVDIQHLMCPLPTTGLPNTMHLTTYATDLLVHKE
jgi:hypothetical protein